MPRSRGSRLLASLLAAGFAVLTVDPAALHACSMHAPTPAAAVSSDDGTAPTSAPVTDGAHSAHAAHSTPGAAASDHPADDGHACTCLGDCAGATPSTVAAEVTSLRTAIVATPLRPGRPAHEYVAAWVDFVLPFATAPPVAPAA